MKILIYGEYWKGTHADCIAEVLAEKRIEFSVFNFFPFMHPSTGSHLADKIYRRLRYTQSEVILNKELLLQLEIYKPDVLLISKGINIFPETLRAFQKQSVMILNWNPDDFFNPANSSDHLRSSIGLYDYVFSARKHLFAEYKAAGIKYPVYLEWYYIPWLHKKTGRTLEIQDKVCFIGSFSKRRESILRSIDSTFPIEIWGAGWSLSTLQLRKNIQVKGKILDQADFPEVISGSRVNLNILTKENRDQTNLKLFEITASNGLLLTEKNAASEALLNSDCYYYQEESEDINTILSRLFNVDRTTEILEKREAAYQRITLGSNTIQDRLENILQIIQ